MARVDVRTQLNMLDTGVWYGQVTSYGSRHITITAGSQSGTYLGSFSYDHYGNVYGRLTGYEASYGGNLEVRVSGVNLDAYWVALQLDRGNADAIQSAALAGDDVLFGAGSADALRGYGGNDQLFGGGGHDRLLGDAGRDRLQGDAGNDRLEGGADTDTAVYAGSVAAHVNLAVAGAQNTGHGWDTLIAIENLVSGSGADVLRGNDAHNALGGSAGNDLLFGAAGNDHLQGGDGHDRLQGDAGDDRLDGGAGTDAAVYAGTVAAQVNLALSARQNTGHGWDTLIGIENLVAGAGSDVLRGNAAANTLVGNAGDDQLYGAGGNDVLHGGEGHDRLEGGAGSDRLTGGNGADRFVFQRGAGTDTVTDFQNGADRFLIGAGAESYGEIVVSDSGANAIIRFADVVIVVANIDHRLLDAGDFVFV